MKSKSTFQIFRDSPNYPVTVTRLVGILHFFLGVMQLIPGVAILTQGQAVYTSLNRSLGGDAAKLVAFYTFLAGFFLVFFGLASLWVSIGNFNALENSWFTTIWVTGLHALAWVLGWAGPPGVLQYLLLFFAVAAVVLYVRDPRIKAIFRRGPVAEQYRQWIMAGRYRDPRTATPWDYPVKEYVPLPPVRKEF